MRHSWRLDAVARRVSQTVRAQSHVRPLKELNSVSADGAKHLSGGIAPLVGGEEDAKGPVTRAVANLGSFTAG
jgi:hypothetical protein